MDKKIKNKKEKKIPYHKKPEDMSVEQWQTSLRKQFGIKQNFKVRNLGEDPVFSDFSVNNPESGNIYKVAIRSKGIGDNFCNCPDFTINGLGTCKHIEFILYNLKKKGDFNKLPYKAGEQKYSSVSLQYRKERNVVLRIGTNNKDKIKELAGLFFDKENVLKAYKKFDIFYKQVKKLDPDFRCYDDAMDYIFNFRDLDNRKDIVDKAFPDGINSKAFKELIKADLYSYQKSGVLFAAKAGRVLIADEMGLGKTIQALAAVEILAKYLGVENVYIICPTSLKYQWKNEIEKFTERQVLVIEGVLKRRKKLYTRNDFYKILSYGMVRNDSGYINHSGPDLIILDEAQRIKNWKTKTAKAVKKLSSEYALVLTGTPLENKIEELHSIIEYIDRFKLGPLFHFIHNHQIIDDNGKVVGYKKLNQINKTLETVLLRRNKQEIIEQLPERIDKNFFVEMTDEQRKIHDDYYDGVCRLVNKWRRFGFLIDNDRKKLLIFLNCMRMVCDSTFILDQITRHDNKIDELMILLKEILEKKENKIVVFSQWERMTRLVAQELDSIDIEYEYLHGGIPSVKRKDLIDNFHNDSNSRVFLSTDAGGVGLNLQCASYLVNLDLPWNPAVLEQRIARIHRIGQKNHVNIVNFISKNSIEERILNLIGFKKSVFKGIFDNGKDAVFLGESNFKKLMKSVEVLTDDNIRDNKKEEENKEEIPESKDQLNLFSEKNKDKLKEKNIVNGIEVKEKGKEGTGEHEAGQKTTAESLNDLIIAGASFLNKLNSTFSDINSGKVSLSSIIEKDKKTGKTSIKIPIENEENLIKTIDTFSSLLKGLIKK